ncbi:hypothetical protein [Terrisporobacter sp.]|uniref:hypothetical protein n=1 Tax=Terrisporobacter sp. TaxID=1965305 RepID=UPI00261B7212|nr:hypothetical protein [Terrisporobacter sp.]
MNQIFSWICLISLCFLCLQVMIYICEDTLKVYNKAMKHNKNRNRTTRKNAVSAMYSYSYENKIAK